MKKEDVGGASSTHDNERAAKITNLMSMGFPKEQCEAALTAAFNNSDRAVEYLLNGIPKSHAEEDAEHGLSIPISREDMAQISRIREQVRADPDSLPNILGELAQSAPGLYTVLLTRVS